MPLEVATLRRSAHSDVLLSRYKYVYLYLR